MSVDPVEICAVLSEEGVALRGVRRTRRVRRNHSLISTADRRHRCHPVALRCQPRAARDSAEAVGGKDPNGRRTDRDEDRRCIHPQHAAHAGSDGPAKRRVRQAMVAASRLRRDVVVPTVVVAELYQGGGRNQLVDALLSREELALVLRDTDRQLARLVGGVLSVAGAGSEDLADAHVVAVAVEGGRGVVSTVERGLGGCWQRHDVFGIESHQLVAASEGVITDLKRA